MLRSTLKNFFWLLIWKIKFYLFCLKVKYGFRRRRCIIVSGMIGCGKTSIIEFAKFLRMKDLKSYSEFSNTTLFWYLLNNFGLTTMERLTGVYYLTAKKIAVFFSSPPNPLSFFDRLGSDSVVFHGLQLTPQTAPTYFEQAKETIRVEGFQLREAADVQLFMINYVNAKVHKEVLTTRSHQTFLDSNEEAVRAAEASDTYNHELHVHLGFGFLTMWKLMGYDDENITEIVKTSGTIDEHERVLKMIFDAAVV